MRTGTADLPLHGGRAPSWLFERGKDGTPYPVDRGTYDATIESLRRAVNEARERSLTCR